MSGLIRVGASAQVILTEDFADFRDEAVFCRFYSS